MTLFRARKELARAYQTLEGSKAARCSLSVKLMGSLLDREGDEVSRRALRAHMEVCASCVTTFNQMKKGSRLYGSIPMLPALALRPVVASQFATHASVWAGLASHIQQAALPIVGSAAIVIAAAMPSQPPNTPAAIPAKAPASSAAQGVSVSFTPSQIRTVPPVRASLEASSTNVVMDRFGYLINTVPAVPPTPDIASPPSSTLPPPQAGSPTAAESPSDEAETATTLVVPSASTEQRGEAQEGTAQQSPAQNSTLESAVSVLPPITNTVTNLTSALNQQLESPLSLPAVELPKAVTLPALPPIEIQPAPLTSALVSSLPVTAPPVAILQTPIQIAAPQIPALNLPPVSAPSAIVVPQAVTAPSITGSVSVPSITVPPAGVNLPAQVTQLPIPKALPALPLVPLAQRR